MSLRRMDSLFLPELHLLLLLFNKLNEMRGRGGEEEGGVVRGAESGTFSSCSQETCLKNRFMFSLNKEKKSLNITSLRKTNNLLFINLAVLHGLCCSPLEFRLSWSLSY